MRWPRVIAALRDVGQTVEHGDKFPGAAHPEGVKAAAAHTFGDPLFGGQIHIAPGPVGTSVKGQGLEAAVWASSSSPMRRMIMVTRSEEHTSELQSHAY